MIKEMYLGYLKWFNSNACRRCRWAGKPTLRRFCIFQAA